MKSPKKLENCLSEVSDYPDLTFTNIYKHRATYNSDKLTIIGVINYRSDLQASMSVIDLWNELDDCDVILK